MEKPQRVRVARSCAALLLLLVALQILAGCVSAPAAPRPRDVSRAPEPTATTRLTATAQPTPSVTPSEQTSSLELMTTTTILTPGEILSTPQLEYGVNAHLFYTDRERALTLSNNAGFEWVRQQIHWKDIEGPTKGSFGWQELDAIVAAANAHNIKLLLNIVRSPAWARADGSDGMPDAPSNLGDFAEALARRYKGRVAAYEIWNEQNLHYENGGTVTPHDAGHYVELLMEAYKRIKAVDPKAFVLAGAPSSTGINDPKVAIDDLTFLRLMYSYKDGVIRDYFDAQAVHPGGAANPPETLWPGNPSNATGWNDHSSFYFRHVENVREVMEEFDLADHQIWITEFGWATANVTADYEFGNQTTFAEQAEYLRDALQWTRSNYPWVGAAFVWNLNFSILWGEQGNALHEQASFSILNPDWSPRPAFTKVQGFIHAVREEEEQER